MEKDNIIQTPEKASDYLAIADSIPAERKQILTNLVGGLIGFADNNIVGYGVGALEWLEGQAYAVQHQKRLYQDLVPMDFSAPEWADSASYEIYDYTGVGKRVLHDAENRNVSNFVTGKKIYSFWEGGVAYNISFTEMLKSIKMNMPIDATRAKAAGEAYANHLNQVALYGELGDPGIFNLPGIPVIASGLAPLGAIDPLNTPEQIYVAMFDAVNVVIQASFENDIPDTFAMDQNVYNYISRTKYDALSKTTILQHFLDNNPSKSRGVALSVVPVPKLDVAGVAVGGNSASRAMIYKKDSSKLFMPMPMPLRFLTPQLRGSVTEHNGIYKYGTVQVRYPKSAAYLDNF